MAPLSALILVTALVAGNTVTILMIEESLCVITRNETLIHQFDIPFHPLTKHSDRDFDNLDGSITFPLWYRCKDHIKDQIKSRDGVSSFWKQIVVSSYSLGKISCTYIFELLINFILFLTTISVKFAFLVLTTQIVTHAMTIAKFVLQVLKQTLKMLKLSFLQMQLLKMWLSSDHLRCLLNICARFSHHDECWGFTASGEWLSFRSP